MPWYAERKKTMKDPTEVTDDASQTEELIGGIAQVLRDSKGWPGEIVRAQKCCHTWNRRGRPDPYELEVIRERTPSLVPTEFFLMFPANGSDLRGCGSKVGSSSYPLIKDMRRVNLHWNHSLFREGSTHRVTVVFSDADAAPVSWEDLGA